MCMYVKFYCAHIYLSYEPLIKHARTHDENREFNNYLGCELVVGQPWC